MVSDEPAVADPLATLGAHIAEALGDAVLDTQVAYGELTVSVERESIVDVARFLKDDPACRFVCVMDVCGVDYPQRERRFDVVYHFLSPYTNRRLRVKLELDDTVSVPSITPVFPGADWFEREAYDLYGVLFDGHPMRKDFPLTGYVEVRYDEERKRVVYEPVKLQQEFRSFDYLSPWEGSEYVLPGDEKASS